MRALLNRLSLRTKMMSIAALALAMSALPLGLYVANALAVWQTAQSEAAALPAAAQLMQLMRYTQQHRGLSNGVLNGNEAGAADRSRAAQALQAELARLGSSMAAVGSAALSQRLADQRQALDALLQAVEQRSIKASDSFARHTRLVDEQMVLLYDVAVESGLVLHPEASGYFLQDAVLRQLPPVAEAVAQLRGAAMGLLAKREASAEDRMRLAALASRARSQAAYVEQALRLAGRTEPALREALAAPLEQAVRLLGEGLAHADGRVIQAAVLDEVPAQWWARMTQVIDAQYQLGDVAHKALESDILRYGRQVQTEMLLGGLGMLLMAVVCLLLIHAVGRQVIAAADDALHLAEAVAAGDLSRRVQVDGRDELARMLSALDTMAAKLGDTVASVRDNAAQVATASSQIAQGNLDLSTRTEEQASALQQTAASIEQLTATVQHTADSARQAHTLAAEAHAVASRGGEAVDAMVSTMKQIDDSSRRIGEIIGTIDGIAFQTNILALNAAVEAARAGEQGRGFAVVAGEVRALAQRSAQAAREVRTLVGASVERAEAGSAQADRAGATMHEVIGAIDRVGIIMRDISSASSEQSSGVAQVDQAMAEIDRATQQNAALVEESAAAAESLRRQADSLQQSVAAFRLA